jgi:hypothetical protein
MTVGYNNFLKDREDKFVTLISKIYFDMGKDDPMKLVDEGYHKIIKNTIGTINGEGRDFIVSYNKTSNFNYDVVFVSKQ